MVRGKGNYKVVVGGVVPQLHELDRVAGTAARLIRLSTQGPSE